MDKHNDSLKSIGQIMLAIFNKCGFDTEDEIYILCLDCETLGIGFAVSDLQKVAKVLWS